LKRHYPTEPDQPSFAAWELASEPRSQPRYDPIEGEITQYDRDGVGALIENGMGAEGICKVHGIGFELGIVITFFHRIEAPKWAHVDNNGSELFAFREIHDRDVMIDPSE
jgi:hypothetical protein